jgi:hypothetical protein
MTTLTEIQADRVSDEARRVIIADQFANDWLLVAMNDQETYSELMRDAEEAQGWATFSDKLRDEWETLAEQVTELVRDNISETASLFIAQMLQGQGTLPFDYISRQVMLTKNETK